MTKTWQVFVYNHHTYGKSGERVNQPLAYTRYYVEGACIHFVPANTRAEALRRAVAEHHLWEHDAADRHCAVCIRNGACLTEKDT